MTGRWIQRDPLGYVDGMGLYEYVRSGPIHAIDSRGLFACVGGQCGPRRADNPWGDDHDDIEDFPADDIPAFDPDPEGEPSPNDPYYGGTNDSPLHWPTCRAELITCLRHAYGDWRNCGRVRAPAVCAVTCWTPCKAKKLGKAGRWACGSCLVGCLAAYSWACDRTLQDRRERCQQRYEECCKK
jgi:hypothetical protein